MPNENWYQLLVEGPADLVATFRADTRLWEQQPWSSMYHPHRCEDTSEAGRLKYRYVDDYKRPGPSIEAIASSYPGLDLCHELCDEFGTRAFRVRYADGAEVETVEVDPSELDWIDWDDDAGTAED